MVRYIRTVFLLFLMIPTQAAAGSKPDLSAYPLLFSRGETISADANVQEIVIVGDLMFTRGIDRVTSVYGMDAPMIKVAQWIKAADLAVANYEGTIANPATGERRSGPYRFKAGPEAAQAIASAGFDLVSVANNHSQDWGPAALQNTVAYLQLAGVKTVGAWSSFESAHQSRIIDLGDVRTVWLAYNYVGAAEQTEYPGNSGWSRAWLKKDRLLKQAARAKENGGIVFVYLHWGVEYADKPESWQALLARAAVDAGADLVVGHHPHVIQTIERYGDGLIAYSLGNFLFDQPERDSGLALWVRLDGKGIVDIRGLTYKPYMQPEWHDAGTTRKLVDKHFMSSALKVQSSEISSSER